jgi:putative ABC transport system permease protein
MSKLSENIRMALTSLLANKFRTFLATLGIGIGIAAVVILVSVGQSVQAYVTRQFLSVGSDLVSVQPVAIANGFGPPSSRSGGSLSSLTNRDLALLQDPFNISNVKAVVPLIRVSRSTTYGANLTRSPIYATTAPYFETLGRSVASGRLFTDQDTQSAARVAVIGQTTLKNLFPSEASPLGETLRIGSVPFKVIGTLEKSGGSSFGADQDDLIVIPITAGQAHLQSDRNVGAQMPLSQIYLQATDVSAIDDIGRSATDLIRTAHKIKPGKDADFQVTAQKDLLSSFDQIIGLLTVFLAIIGSVSLLVGGIGVMNIMLVTVTERTAEIGLRKAVGARRLDVMLQFLVEAIVLCLVGGTAGMLLATGALSVLGLAIPDLSPSVSPLSVALAVSVTTLIGVFFGFYPANRAAALSPIQALRAE